MQCVEKHADEIGFNFNATRQTALDIGPTALLPQPPVVPPQSLAIKHKIPEPVAPAARALRVLRFGFNYGADFTSAFRKGRKDYRIEKTSIRNQNIVTSKRTILNPEDRGSFYSNEVKTMDNFGAICGSWVGSISGSLAGAVIGSVAGAMSGSVVGSLVGSLLGSLAGSIVGSYVGSSLGAMADEVVAPLWEEFQSPHNRPMKSAAVFN